MFFQQKYSKIDDISRINRYENAQFLYFSAKIWYNKIKY